MVLAMAIKPFIAPRRNLSRRNDAGTHQQRAMDEALLDDFVRAYSST